MQYLANPTRFLRIANAVLPYVWALRSSLLAVGLYGALVTAPPDYQQGETVRIMYVHVPAAWMALFVYTVMALASAVAIIFRHPAGGRRGQGCGTDRCCLLFPRAGHRLALGQAHVGCLVGMGCTAHIDVRAVPSLYRLHGHLAGNR